MKYIPKSPCPDSLSSSPTFPENARHFPAHSAWMLASNTSPCQQHPGFLGWAPREAESRALRHSSLAGPARQVTSLSPAGVSFALGALDL